jgi:hypothetical protein
MVPFAKMCIFVRSTYLPGMQRVKKGSWLDVETSLIGDGDDVAKPPLLLAIAVAVELMLELVTRANLTWPKPAMFVPPLCTRRIGACGGRAMRPCREIHARLDALGTVFDGVYS